MKTICFGVENKFMDKKGRPTLSRSTGLCFSFWTEVSVSG